MGIYVFKKELMLDLLDKVRALGHAVPCCGCCGRCGCCGCCSRFVAHGAAAVYGGSAPMC